MLAENGTLAAANIGDGPAGRRGARHLRRTDARRVHAVPARHLEGARRSRGGRQRRARPPGADRRVGARPAGQPRPPEGRRCRASSRQRRRPAHDRRPRGPTCARSSRRATRSSRRPPRRTRASPRSRRGAARRSCATRARRCATSTPSRSRRGRCCALLRPAVPLLRPALLETAAPRPRSCATPSTSSTRSSTPPRRGLPALDQDPASPPGPRSRSSTWPAAS